MSIQSARLRNMQAIAARLVSEGFHGKDAMARYLGPAFTARRLETLLAGGPMTAMCAWALEHRLQKSRGWLDADRVAEIVVMPLPALCEPATGVALRDVASSTGGDTCPACGGRT
jgi:hypothetical protein